MHDKANAEYYARLSERLPSDLEWSDPFAAEYAPLRQRNRDRYGLVERMEAAGRLAEAAGVLDQLLARDPNDYLPHLMLGRILGQMSEFQRAEEHLHIALRLAPDKVQARYLLALVQQRRGEALAQRMGAGHAEVQQCFAAAAATAREVVAARSDHGFAQMTLGLALNQLVGRRSDAIAALRQAVHCNPEYADIHLALGTVLAEDGQLDAARAPLEQAQRLAMPNDPRPRAALQRFYPANDVKSER